MPAARNWAGRRWGPSSSCSQRAGAMPRTEQGLREGRLRVLLLWVAIHRRTLGSAWPLVALGMLAPAGTALVSEGPLAPVLWDPMLVFHALQ